MGDSAPPTPPSPGGQTPGRLPSGPLPRPWALSPPSLFHRGWVVRCHPPAAPALAPEEVPLSGTPHLSFLWFVPSHPPVTCRERQEIVGVPCVRKCLLSPRLLATGQEPCPMAAEKCEGTLCWVPPVSRAPRMPRPRSLLWHFPSLSPSLPRQSPLCPLSLLTCYGQGARCPQRECLR